MIVYPALDLKDGRVVQLVGGRPEEERVNLPDPAALARRWLDAGFSRLHVIDLDAALERGDNRAGIRAVQEVVRARRDRERDGGRPGRKPDASTAARPLLQVGGGIRDRTRAEELLDSGVDRIIVGTRAVDDPDWLEGLVGRHAGRVLVAADVRGDEVVTRGWTEASGRRLDDLLEALEPLPLAGILVTDVGREGRMEGVDGARFERLRRGTRHPVLAAGGIGCRDDVDALARAGVAGAVIGMALYTGAVDATAVARDYGS